MFRKKIVSAIVFLLIIGSCTLLASADQTNDSDKYTFQNYGGEVYTPEPIEFGANLNDNFIPEYGTERKHMMFQFYETPNEEELELLENYGVQRVAVAAKRTLICSIPADMTAADLPAESGLRWMGEIPVENKYDQNYGLNVPEWARTENGKVKLAIHFYEDVTSQDSINIAEKYSESFSATSKLRPWYYETITNETNIALIASEDTVQLVGYYGYETIPTEGSDFVDYEVINEEDETEPVNEQEDNIQETAENYDDQEEKKSRGFTVTIGVLILSLIAIFKGNTKSKRK